MSTAEGFGNNLIEISAVTTIIGAPTAEALIHGLKGACGMAWAPMSSFGSVHVTKACLSASIPDWLRDALGLSSAFVDAATGVAVRVNQFKHANRVDLGDACAIQVIFAPKLRALAQQTSRGHKQKATTDLEQGHYGPTQFEYTGMCVYTLDKMSQLALNTIPVAQYGEAVSIHMFVPDLDGIVPAWKDWVILLSSLVKTTEALCLWRLGSHKLWYWTIVGWSHAFVAAVILQLFGLGRDSPLTPASDIISGILPTPLHLGGNGKLVLGMPRNVRRHPLWRILLSLGIIFNAAGIFGTFIFMRYEPSVVVYVWIAFQILWLVARTVVFYFTDGAAAIRQGVIATKTWDEVTNEDRHHIMILLGELSKHQVSIHPRGVEAYRHDCLSFCEISPHFDEANWTLTMRLPYKAFGIDIKAVAGDPLIRSAVWFTAANLNNMELYDAAIAFVRGSKGILAIPCVRVYACECPRNGDHPQRGVAHTDCGKLEWLYFIPTDADSGRRWIYAHGLCGVGLLMSESLDDDALNRQLAIGRWRISLKSIIELRDALDVSRSGGAVVMNMMQSARDTTQKQQRVRDDWLEKGDLPGIEVQL